VLIKAPFNGVQSNFSYPPEAEKSVCNWNWPPIGMLFVRSWFKEGLVKAAVEMSAYEGVC